MLGTSTTSNGYVTQDELAAAIAQVTNALGSLISEKESAPGSVYATGGYTNEIALTNNIDNLSGSSNGPLTISNPTISNPVLTGSVSGLTTSDLSDFSYATTSDLVQREGIVAWGDSLLTNKGGATTTVPAQITQATGYYVYNGGVAGQTSTQIAGRMLTSGALLNYPTIIWAGYNDYNSPTQVESDIASMVASLGANENYLILAIINSGGAVAQESGGSDYNNIVAINSYLASTYGARFLDVRSFLISHYDPTQPQDVIDFGNVVIPSSLVNTGVRPHLNAAGYILVAQDILSNFSELVGGSNTSLVSSQNIGALVSAPPVIGGITPNLGYFSAVDTLNGLTQSGSTILIASSTTNSLSVGLSSGGTASTGSLATAVGYEALFKGTSAADNTAVGAQAIGNAAATGAFNTAVGFKTLFNQTSGAGNTALGAEALLDNTTGSDNTAVGYLSLLNNVSATNTVAIGFQAGIGGSGANSLDNVFVGVSSGKNNTIGSSNTLLGYQSGQGLTTGSYNIIIGNNVDAVSTTTSQELDIGDLLFGINLYANQFTVSSQPVSAGKISVGTTTPYARLSVWGSDTASSTLAFNVVSSASTTVFAVFDGGNAQLSGTLTQSSDERLKTNILSLDASSSLSLIDELNPVTFNWINPYQGTTPQLGFIAQQVQQIFPSLVSTTSATALTPGGTLGLNYIGLISPIVSAIQALSSEVQGLIAEVQGFAQSFTSNTITASNDLCVSDGPNDPAPICVTKAQLAAVLAGNGSGNNQSPAAAQQSPAAGSNPPVSVTQNSATTTPPTITINGDNPAYLNVGDSYADLGATVTDDGPGQAGDANLGYKTLLNGTLVSNIALDSSQLATDTIDYVATDSAGLTATSTRTILIEPVAPSAAATTTTTTATN